MNPQGFYEKFVEVYSKGWDSGFWIGLEVGALLMLMLFFIRGLVWFYQSRKEK